MFLPDTGLHVCAEANKPSSLGASSISLSHSVLQKQARLNLCISLNLQNKFHYLFSFLRYVSILDQKLEKVILNNVL